MTLNNSSIMVPMTSTLRFLAITILFLVCVVEANSQDNKISKNGERKGEWLILYGGNGKTTDLIGEAPSIEKITLKDNEVSELNDASYIEVVSYKSGIKNGEFQFYNAKKDYNNNYRLIASGKYRDGQIQGDVIYYKGGGNVPKSIFTIKYRDNKPVDQYVSLNDSPVSFTPKKGPQNQVLVKPYFRIENGECVDQISMALTGTRLVWTTRNGVLIKQFKYFKEGTKLMPSYYTDGSSCFQYAEKRVEESTGNWVLEGRLMVYHDTGIAFDTSKVYMESRAKEGLLNGICRYYDRDENLLIEANYKAGILDGIAHIYNPKLKRPIIKMNYKDGYFHGKYTTYYTDEGKNISLISPNCVHQHQNIWSDDYFFKNATNKIMGEMIPLIRSKGYKINTSDFFKIYEAEYFEGKVQSIEYYHSDGSLLYRELGSQCDDIKGEKKNIEDIAAMLTQPLKDYRGGWAWFEADGTPIYTSEMERVAKAEVEKFKTCASCRREVATEEAIFRFGDYRCFDKHGDSRYIFSMTPTYFCSLQCQMAHEEHECINNGFSYKKP